jgi:hypothetical protein
MSNTSAAKKDERDYNDQNDTEASPWAPLMVAVIPATSAKQKQQDYQEYEHLRFTSGYAKHFERHWPAGPNRHLKCSPTRMKNDVRKARTKSSGSPRREQADGLLMAAARKIGSAAAVVVSLTGMHETPAQAKIAGSTVKGSTVKGSTIKGSAITGKLPKGNKTRVPRRPKQTLRKNSPKRQPAST